MRTSCLQLSDFASWPCASRCSSCCSSTVLPHCAAEVPVFFYSGRILERLGVERALHVAMGCYVLRLCCYLVGGWAGERVVDCSLQWQEA